MEMKSCWNPQEHGSTSLQFELARANDQRQWAKIRFGRCMIRFPGSLENYGRDDIDP